MQLNNTKKMLVRLSDRPQYHLLFIIPVIALALMVPWSLVWADSCHDHSHEASSTEAHSASNTNTEATTETIKEGNVWTTADGKRYFTCPVMGGEDEVSEAPGLTDLDGVRYYHCCPPCQAPFRANPTKWLKSLALPVNIVTVDDEGIKHFRDPVNDEVSTVSKDTPNWVKDNKMWYFTSAKNMKAFKKSPEKFMASK